MGEEGSTMIYLRRILHGSHPPFSGTEPLVDIESGTDKAARHVHTREVGAAGQNLIELLQFDVILRLGFRASRRLQAAILVLDKARTRHPVHLLSYAI
jgi:hypothetical protein